MKPIPNQPGAYPKESRRVLRCRYRIVGHSLGGYAVEVDGVLKGGIFTTEAGATDHMNNLIKAEKPIIVKFNIPTGAELRETGMSKAIDHANTSHANWSEVAYKFLLEYVSKLSEGSTFLTEDVRAASLLIVPEPPSLRAWGGIIRRAAISGVVSSAGYESVSNPKAHCATARVWRKVSNQ